MKAIKISFLLIFIILISSCSPKIYEKEFFAMDTIMNIKMYGNDDFTDINTQIMKYDTLFDRTDENGDIFKINAHNKTEIADETKEILNTARNINKLTNGAFDIRIAPIMDLWGFYGKEYKVPTSVDLSLIEQDLIINDNTVQLCDGAIDLGGIAKGYLSDKLAEVIRNKGVTSSVISLGGNIYCIGTKPDGSKWNIGITNPKDTSSAIGSVKVCDTAVVTSGIYERGFYENDKYYHHIIDPKTGYPADTGLLSVTVISKSGTKADALSTALFVLGMDKAMEIKTDDFEIIFITDKNEIYITEGLDGIFSSEQKFNILKNPKQF